MRSCAAALLGLAPHLSEESLETALTIASKLSDETVRRDLLVQIAPYLEGRLLIEAWGIAEGITDRQERVLASTGLSTRLTSLPNDHLYQLWKAKLSTLATSGREDMLVELLAHVPMMEALGGKAAVAETFHAVQDIGRWWP